MYEQVAGTPALILKLDLRNRLRKAARIRFAAQLAQTFGSARASGVFAQASNHRYPAPVTDSGIDGLYRQPGEVFSGSSVHTVAGRALRRDGRTLLVATGGRVATHKAVTAGSVEGAVTWSGLLRSGEHKTLTIVLPLAPPLADLRLEAELGAVNASEAIRSVKSRWRARLAPATARIKIPEKKARDALLAGLVTMLQSRMPASDGSGAWVQHVNALQYRAFWLRDSALIAGALGRVGLHEAMREDIAFIRNWQTPSGQLLSRQGQVDGTGQGLWVLGEYARQTRDVAWSAQQLTTVRRAVDWIAAVRGADPLGLLPEGDPRDNEFAKGHLTGDNAWAVSGLRAAADLATIAGDGALATQATVQARQLADALRAAALRASKRTADGAVPASLGPGGQSGAIDGGSEGFDWGNYMLHWPEALGANDPLVGATVKRARRRSREGLPLWHGNLHTYLGFGTRMSQLRAGDQAAVVNGYYAMLTHTNSTHGAFETGVGPFKGRSARNNIAPHGTFAADLAMLTIAMLIDDRPDAVHLASAVPPAWVRPGQTTRIGPIATRRGHVTIRIEAHRNGARLSWTVGPSVELVAAPAPVGGRPRNNRLHWQRLKELALEAWVAKGFVPYRGESAPGPISRASQEAATRHPVAGHPYTARRCHWKTKSVLSQQRSSRESRRRGSTRGFSTPTQPGLLKRTTR